MREIARQPRCSTTRRALRRAGGFTLIEIMMVMALASLLATSAAVGFSSLRRGRLRAGAAHVASAMRRAYVHALTTGRTTRLVFAVGGNRYWIEDTDDAHVLDASDPLRQGGAAPTAEAAEAAARDRARDIARQRPRAPRAEFNRPRGQRYEPRALADDVTIARLFTSQAEEPREEGDGYVYFWAGGIGERSVVQLRGASGEVYSVVLHPLTGRSEIFDRAVEPPAVDPADQTDQNEIDARQLPGAAP